MNIKDKLRLLRQSTSLFMCRDLVVQSYNVEIDLQQSEAKRYSKKVIVDLHSQIMERLNSANLDKASLDLVKSIVNEILVSHIPSDAAEANNQNMSATSMMLYKKIIFDVFLTISQRINSLVNHIEAQESEWMSLDAHLGAADEKTLAMQLFDALKAVEREKAIADNEYQRQLESIESLKRQREILVNRRVQLIKQIAEKENANDDNARIVKYAAMSMHSNFESQFLL